MYLNVFCGHGILSMRTSLLLYAGFPNERCYFFVHDIFIVIIIIISFLLIANVNDLVVIKTKM